MVKRQFASSARARQAVKSVKHMPDSAIDFSDVPESTDQELKRARRVGRPRTGEAKQLIAIRISPRVLAKLRRVAESQKKPYQTLIHEILDKVRSMAKVTSKLQVTIPKAMADQYGIRPGVEIDWIPAGDAIRVVPTKHHGSLEDATARLRLFDEATTRRESILANGGNH